MTTGNELSKRQAAGLLSKPQRYGILPTWSYWNTPPWSSRLRVSVWACGGVAGIAGYILCRAFALPLSFVAVLLVLSGVLFLGLVERRVRAELAPPKKQAIEE